jgi:hypothetical protein
MSPDTSFTSPLLTIDQHCGDCRRAHMRRLMTRGIVSFFFECEKKNQKNQKTNQLKIEKRQTPERKRKRLFFSFPFLPSPLLLSFRICFIPFPPSKK